MTATPQLIILDMDGTLTPYPRLSALHDAPLVPLPGVIRKLWRLHFDGVTLALATNQVTGIWNGHLYDEWVIRQRLDDLCEFLPLRRDLMLYGLVNSAWWKPAQGMTLELLRRTGVKAENAQFVGDSESDRLAAGPVPFQWAWDFFGWPNGSADRTVDWASLPALYRQSRSLQ